MRILIATTLVPFVRGGAEMQVEGLAAELQARGHETEIASIPFKWYPPERIADHMLASRLLDVSESCGETVDRVIAIKFPAYCLSHPHKTLWLAHQYRSAYDGWEAGTSELLHEPLGAQVRDLVRAADANVLNEARGVFTISKTVSARLQTFCGVTAKPLYHPPPQAGRFHAGDDGDYFLVPSRITPSKRQRLILQAVERTTQPVRICFLGAAEGPRATAEFRQAIADSSAADRVKWIGNVSEDRKIETYAGCRGVVFAPFEEDYGYITLEAMLSSKPIITCTDSGGPLEFVRHEETGLVCDPTPDALAVAMDALWRDKSRAKAYGEAGRQAYADANISWESVVSCLLA